MVDDKKSLRDDLKKIPDYIVDQTSISIGRDLKDFLDTLKVTPRESYHAEIKRLLEEASA
jgi:UDP-galactopyranose mutase